MNLLVHVSLSPFVPSRDITDNIIRSPKLIKWYGRNHISPLFMMYSDMKKAYESIEWHFLE